MIYSTAAFPLDNEGPSSTLTPWWRRALGYTISAALVAALLLVADFSHSEEASAAGLPIGNTTVEWANNQTSVKVTSIVPDATVADFNAVAASLPKRGDGQIDGERWVEESSATFSAEAERVGFPQHIAPLRNPDIYDDQKIEAIDNGNGSISVVVTTGLPFYQDTFGVIITEGWAQNNVAIVAGAVGLASAIVTSITCWVYTGGLGSWGCTALGGAINGLASSVTVLVLNGQPFEWKNLLQVTASVAAGAFLGVIGSSKAASVVVVKYFGDALIKVIDVTKKVLVWFKAGGVGNQVGAILDWLRTLWPPAFRSASADYGLPQITTPVEARILPLGDAWTVGAGAPAQQGGYRATMQSGLGYMGQPYTFVGSQSSGDMPHPQHEGHFGWNIAQIREIAQQRLTTYRPNVVLLNAGTKNIIDASNVPDDVAAMRGLIDSIRANAPGATLLVGGLVPNGNKGPNDEFDVDARYFNRNVQAYINSLPASAHVRWVDMGAVKPRDLTDVYHPSSSAYYKVDLAFTAALAGTIADDWLRPADGGSGQGGGAWQVPSGRPLKTMVVADSIGQGHEGDYTWRYRLDQWFDSQRVPVDFVGPYRGTYTAEAPYAPRPPKILGAPKDDGTLRVGGGYASVNGSRLTFDSDHFAVWGRQVAQDKELVRGVMAGLDRNGDMPDLLLVELGFNDMGWWVSDADGTLRSMKTLVDNARAANPNVAFVIANVPQRTDVGRPDLVTNTNKYNAALATAIPQWSTNRSPIKLADFNAAYGCNPQAKTCDSAYDGLHPTALGEYRIARAFESALASSVLPGVSVPAVPAASSLPSRPLAVPRNLQYDGTGQGVTVTWDPIYGAYSYDVQWRDVTAGTSWEDATSTYARWDKSWQFLSPVNKGHTYEVRVRASAGNSPDRKSGWSGSVRGVAAQRVAPPPRNISTSPTATGVDVTWDLPQGDYTDSIGSYALWVWDRTTPGAFPGADGITVGQTRAHIDGLTPGHTYMIFMASWNAAGEGLPEVARPVIPGAGAPARPTGLTVQSVDPTSVRVTWNGAASAAGYRVWTRNVNDPGSTSKANGVEMGTSADLVYMYPGVWNYEICVSAVNGGMESAKSTCQVAPRPPGS